MKLRHCLSRSVFDVCVCTHLILLPRVGSGYVGVCLFISQHTPGSLPCVGSGCVDVCFNYNTHRPSSSLFWQRWRLVWAVVYSVASQQCVCACVCWYARMYV